MKKWVLTVLLVACAGAANARGADGDFLDRKERALAKLEVPVDPELARCGGFAIVVNGEKVYCQ